MHQAKYSFVITLILPLLAFQCENQDVPMSDTSFINYGTSFGFCAGYCFNSLDISNDVITYTSKSWSQEDPNIICSETVNIEVFGDLVSKIDFQEFKQLPETIGCPDCADGGAEWIEITHDGVTHKVTFGFSNEPATVSNYIVILRDLLEQSDNCK